MKIKWLIAISFLSILSFGETHNDTPQLDPIRLEDTYAADKSIYRWQKVPVLFGRAAISQIDSSRPIVPCERVLKGSQETQALLKKIFQEQEAMLKLIESLKDASPAELERKLHLLRIKLRKIEDMQSQLSVLYPAEFQIKDRVRTISWKIMPHHFINFSEFPAIPRFEWAQLEVLSGDGGWFGNFLSRTSSERPLRQRFEAFLKRFENSPQLQAEIRQAFGNLLNEINQHFADGTPGSKGVIDWQGGQQEIQLMQELTPVEACIPHVALTSSLLIDLEYTAPGEAPNPMYPSIGKATRLGMGPVLLTYYEAP